MYCASLSGESPCSIRTWCLSTYAFWPRSNRALHWILYISYTNRFVRSMSLPPISPLGTASCKKKDIPYSALGSVILLWKHNASSIILMDLQSTLTSERLGLTDPPPRQSMPPAPHCPSTPMPPSNSPRRLQTVSP